MKRLLVLLLLASCGNEDATVLQRTQFELCNEVNDACSEDAQAAGSILAFYGRIVTCSSDLGTCIAVRTATVTCHDGCELAYAHNMCVWECERHRD